jgi:hypothetical protein
MLMTFEDLNVQHGHGVCAAIRTGSVRSAALGLHLWLAARSLAMPPTESHKWQFRPRFRKHAFGWRSQPAIQRIREAVSEIRKEARVDPVVGAEGAVILLERLSPALEHVDSSSGAIGTAVNNAIRELVPLIAGAPAAEATRVAWLDRLWAAHEADEIPYIESLGDYWGELCASKPVASSWADRLIGIVRLALSADKSVRGHFHGTAACLSTLYRAERHQEIVDLLEVDTIWPYKQWAVKALAAMGRKAEAIRYAEASRDAWTPGGEVDRACEDILLSSGMAEEAYRRYGLRASAAGTYLATFRAVVAKYPHKAPRDVLADLVKTRPGEEGKWFAAAKEAGLYDEALALASRTPCDPRTLARAARDFAETQPRFAVGSGLLALHWLVEGFGYEITSADVWAAYSSTMKAAERAGTADEVRARVRTLVGGERAGGFVSRILGRELGL